MALLDHLATDELRAVLAGLEGGSRAIDVLADLERLFVDLPASISRERLIEVAGHPVYSAYGTDTYVALGARVVVGWDRRSGTIDRATLTPPSGDDGAGLVRKARVLDAQAAPPSMPGDRISTLTVADDRGVLAVIDPAAYSPPATDADFRAVSRHLTRSMSVGEGVFWMTGWREPREYVIEVRERATARTAFREVEHFVDVTEGRLGLAGYRQLVDESTATVFEVPDGRYSLLIRQLIDPAGDTTEKPEFEVVYTADVSSPRVASTRPLWWATNDDAESVVMLEGLPFLPTVVRRSGGELVMKMLVASGHMDRTPEFTIDERRLAVLRDDLDRYLLLYVALHHPYQLRETELSPDELDRYFETILFGDPDAVDAFLSRLDAPAKGALSWQLTSHPGFDLDALRAGRWMRRGSAG